MAVVDEQRAVGAAAIGHLELPPAERHEFGVAAADGVVGEDNVTSLGATDREMPFGIHGGLPTGRQVDPSRLRLASAAFPRPGLSSNGLKDAVKMAGVR